jgi:hypothetical protein
MRLLAVMLAATLSSASGNERAMGMLRDWIKAVDQHAAGESDHALGDDHGMDAQRSRVDAPLRRSARRDDRMTIATARAADDDPRRRHGGDQGDRE